MSDAGLAINHPFPSFHIHSQLFWIFFISTRTRADAGRTGDQPPSNGTAKYAKGKIGEKGRRRWWNNETLMTND
ncbi:MAG TPA: hypothetical protein VK815_05720 [Candidatus Acidoferrales bacterium]|nr:hypothetical protein [Candidatus Acidoferrales bacterium]